MNSIRFNSFFNAAVLVVGGVTFAIVVAVLSVRYLPEDNQMLPLPGSNQMVTTGALDKSNLQLGEVERGRVYFVQLCVSCHGVRGDGAGEWAYRVTPYPADLRKARTQNRSDQALFDIISNSLVATPMKGWKDQLSVTQRWQIVTYLRSLADIDVRPEKEDLHT